MTSRERRRIERQDAERRTDRLVAEYMDLNRRYQRSENSLTRADGMPLDFVPNEHRDVRASTPWPNRLHAVGTHYTLAELAAGAEPTAPTVLIRHADGTTDVQTVREIRSGGRTRTTTQSAPQQSDVQRYADIIGNADYLAGGDA